MRPPNCFGGNTRRCTAARRCCSRFNEAAELLRRKPLRISLTAALRVMASMRPPNCFGGNGTPAWTTDADSALLQ